MSVNSENRSTTMDSLKWLLVFGVLAAAVVGNQMFAEMSVLVRAVAVVIAVALALFIAAQTEKGQQFMAFVKEARTETRKVVWPTRQEALQTTFIVMAVTVIVGLILWGMDGIFVRLVAFMTGLEI